MAQDLKMALDNSRADSQLVNSRGFQAILAGMSKAWRPAKRQAPDRGCSWLSIAIALKSSVLVNGVGGRRSDRLRIVHPSMYYRSFFAQLSGI